MHLAMPPNTLQMSLAACSQREGRGENSYTIKNTKKTRRQPQTAAMAEAENCGCSVSDCARFPPGKYRILTFLPCGIVMPSDWQRQHLFDSGHICGYRQSECRSLRMDIFRYAQAMAHLLGNRRRHRLLADQRLPDPSRCCLRIAAGRQRRQIIDRLLLFHQPGLSMRMEPFDLLRALGVGDRLALRTTHQQYVAAFGRRSRAEVGCQQLLIFGMRV